MCSPPNEHQHARASGQPWMRAASYRRLYIAMLRLDVVSLSVRLQTAREAPRASGAESRPAFRLAA